MVEKKLWVYVKIIRSQSQSVIYKIIIVVKIMVFFYMVPKLLIFLSKIIKFKKDRKKKRV